MEYKPPIFVPGLTKPFEYQKSNHFRDWVLQVQSKQATYIPKHVIVTVRKELDALWITEPKDVTYKVIRNILKRMKLSKYFEHIHYIQSILTNAEFTIPDHIVQKMFNMFKDMQEPYERLKPKNRKSFFSYEFILHKFFLILGYPEYAKLFRLLKGRSKVYKQELVFRMICDELKWSYIASV